MEPQIRTGPIEYTVSGFSLRHDPGKKFGEEIMALLGRVWPAIKASGVSHDGINRVVYESDERGCTVFAGVVLAGEALGMERKAVRLGRHAWWKHIGPYHLIAATGSAMTQALAARGVRLGSQMVEVYGHWNQDQSKLETETFVAVV